MKTFRIPFALALSGLLLFSCNEEMEVGPEKNIEDLPAFASKQMGADASARVASSSDDVIDFESLETGTIVSEVYSANGAGPVKVWGENPNFPGQNAAMIFDSSNPTGNDPDLGTPNEDFGGPGIGAGGESGKPYENSVSLGKILIITEDFDSTDPDDADLVGSSYTLDFSALGSVSVYSMYILDVETGELSATVTFYNSAGEQIGSEYVLPKTGNNGAHNYLFGTGVEGVAEMFVNINGSGAIDNIVFSAEETPPPSEGGCTYTQGYWKNHTKYGAPRRDDTWDKIGPQGEDTEFFLAEASYLEVMKTAPKKGNAYYILAPQYIAAKLNILNGASAPEEVQDAISGSEALFSEYTPAEIERLKGNDPLREQFLEYADLLDKYNNGVIGPGHCD